MQNEQMTVRGYSPQNTGRIHYDNEQLRSEKDSGWQAIWMMLDPAAVALLAAGVLGLIYALYATISYWWLTKILMHLILTWLTVGINAVAMFRSDRRMMAVAVVGYIVSMLLFVNYLYLLIPSALLCVFAWWKSKE